MNLIAIVPAYNEAANIASVIADISNTLPGISIAVIDDGSVDNTAQIARQAGAIVLRLPHNLGIGGAVQTGLRFAVYRNADYVIRLDGDGQHPASQISLLLEPVMRGDIDIAIGSRFIRKATPRAVSFPRRVGILIFCMLTSLLSGHKVTDPTSGFMVMNTRVAAFLARNTAQDYPEADARVLLGRGGFKIREIYTQMCERQGGVSSITPARALYYVFKVSLSVLAARSRIINRSLLGTIPDNKNFSVGKIEQPKGD
jgi:glycosyltransferase involved in cell wall biosynthesis